MVKIKKFNALMLIFALLGSIMLLLAFLTPNYEKNNKVFKSAILECKKTYTGGEPCFDIVVSEHAEKISVAMMLKTIDALNKEKLLGGKCHEIMHAVGVAYYSESMDDVPLVKMCGLGLIHGLLQAAAIKGDSDRVAYLLAHQCTNKEKVIDPSCTHGMGHDLKLEGLANTSALAHCEKLMPLKENNYQLLVFSCLEGFFMQDSRGMENKKKTGKRLFLPMAINPVYTEEGRKHHCDNGVDLELRAACKVVLYRFSYANFYLNSDLEGSNEFSNDYLQKQCNTITKGEMLKHYCFRQAGVVAFAHSEMTDQYNIASFQRFCNLDMELDCLGAYFEQITSTGVSVEFVKIENDICKKLASKEEKKCMYIGKAQNSRN